jgi:chromosome partitioning protein
MYTCSKEGDEMARIFVISNAKGGILKSTLVSNLAAASVMTSEERNTSFLKGLKKKDTQLERKEITGKTLIIDLDPQSNQLQNFGLKEQDKTIYNVMLQALPISEAIYPINDYIDILPSGYMMNFLNYQVLTNQSEFQDHLGLINRALDDEVLNRYRYIFIDTPPSFSVETLSAFNIPGAELIIPVQPETNSIEGLRFLFESVIPDMKERNPSLSVIGMVVTLYEKRGNFHDNMIKDELEPLIKEHDIPLLDSIVSKSVGQAKSVYENKKPIVMVDKKHSTSQQLFKLWEEIQNG